MRFIASAFLGLALLVLGDVSWAQTEEQTQEEKAWSQLFFEEFLLRSCDDPTQESAIALPQPKLILEATDDGKTKAKARIGLNIKRTFVVNLEVESPRDSSGETELASLDGLSNGGNAELKLSWFDWRPRSYTSERLARLRQDSSARGGAAERAYSKMYSLVSGSFASEEANPEDTGGRMTDYLKPAVSRPSATAILARAEESEYKEAAEIYRDWLRYYDRVLPVLTLTATARQKEFEFFLPSAGPPAGLRQTSESHTNYQITGSAGAYLWGRFYSSLNYRRGTEYVDGSTQEFCAPMGAARILDCINPVVAPPKKRRPEVLEFEVRGLAGSLGLAAHVTRNLENNVTVIELPVYILQKLGTSQMELNLGAKAQWRSDTDDFSLSVFLGPAFSTVLRMFNR